MKTLTLIILTLISLSVLGQDYEVKGDTLIILEDGYYRYYSDTLFIEPPSEKEQIIEAISNSLDIIFLMGKYIESLEPHLETEYYRADYDYSTELNIIRHLYEIKTFDVENGYIKISYNTNKPTLEGFYEWIIEQTQ